MKIRKYILPAVLGFTVLLFNGCGTVDDSAIENEATLQPTKAIRVTSNDDIISIPRVLFLDINDNGNSIFFDFMDLRNSKNQQIYIDIDYQIVNGTPTGFTLAWIDTDKKQGLGAEYLIENGYIYQYTGSGGWDWSWRYVGKATKKQGFDSTLYKVRANLFFPIASDSISEITFRAQAVTLNKRWNIVSVDDIVNYNLNSIY